MELIKITQHGLPASVNEDLPKMAIEIISLTTEMYKATGYEEPWIGYLALENSKCIGTCAFKTPPQNNEVEIAYYTFPDYEGRGIATRMASELINIAHVQLSSLTITAQTLPVENASNRILIKLGFVLSGEIADSEIGRVWEWKLTA